MDPGARTSSGPGATRRAIIDAALRLFAEQGYAATSVAQIGQAAGLSPGAGGLYRHFRSKEELLAAALDDVMAREPAVEPAQLGEVTTLEERLEFLCRRLLGLLDTQRELTRITMRDLEAFPELLARRREDLQSRYTLMALWLSVQPEAQGAGHDWDAVASVLAGSVIEHWIFADVFGEAPGRITRDRFIATWVRTAALAVRPA